MSATPIVLAAGGTGGHLFPAEALAAELVRRGRMVLLATDPRGKAFAALPDVAVHHVRSATLGGGLLGKLRAVIDLGLGTLEARRLLKRLAPAAVVGFGGYPSVPTVFAAQRLGIPTILHEQNAVLGRANRLLAGKAAMVATSFPEVRGLPAGVRTVRTGNPVRPGILELASHPYPVPYHGGTLHVLVTGGSQGASVFSTILPAAVARLPEELRMRLRIAQQARNETIEAARAGYGGLGVEVELAPFFRDMPAKLAGCHLAICRSGASTIAELAVVGRPSILVPYPHAMDDHQTANARALEAVCGAWVMPQQDFTAESLADRLAVLMKAPELLAGAAANARAWAVADAAARLADMVEEIAPGNGAGGKRTREAA